MVRAGDVVRITTRSEAGRAAIEAAGAECRVGTPDRLATLSGVLEAVTIVCWLLGTATGTADQLRALHGPRLESFLAAAIDTTMRGLIYESCGPSSSTEALLSGARIVEDLAERNAIPVELLTSDPRDTSAWLAQALAAVDSLLGRR